MTENKKKKIILLSAIAFMLASIIVLVVYFSAFRQKTQGSDAFTISCPNLEMQVGQIKPLPLEVSYQEAQLCYQIENSSIVMIKNNKITALSAGETMVKVEAEYQGKQAFCSFVVSVASDGLGYALTENDNCKIYNNKIYLTSSSCQFSLSVYDQFNKLILNPKVKLSSSDPENISIEKVAFGYFLSAKEDGFVTFDFYQYDYSLTFEVIAL